MYYATMKTNKLVMAALMISLIAVTTIFFKIPVPLGNGYIHLGDAMIFMSVLILGAKYGAIAAAAGSAMGDVISGYAIWAPWTIAIKGVMALIMGFFILKSAKRTMNRIIGMLLSGLWMTAGYFIAEGIVYGNWFVALVSVPFNVGQFAMGIAIALPLSEALGKTPAGKLFFFER